MNALAFLELLERLEQAMHDLYVHCQDCFAHDKKAAAVFYRLALDEENHRNLVGFQKRLVQAEPQSFRCVDVDPKQINDDVMAAHDFFQSTPGRGIVARFFKRTTSSRTLRDATLFALELESRAAERHLLGVELEADESLGRLMGNLRAGDEKHIALLRNFAIERRFLKTS